MAEDDGLLDATLRMVGEQLQHTDEVPNARAGAEPLLQRLPQLGEGRRQLPIPVHGGVVQGSGLPLQNHQEMQRIKDTLALAVAAGVTGDGLTIGYHLDAFDVAFDGHGAEGPASGHAITVVIETHRLVLVHLPGLQHAGIEGMGWDRQGGGPVAFEADTDRLGLRAADPVLLGLATATQVGV